MFGVEGTLHDLSMTAWKTTKKFWIQHYRDIGVPNTKEIQPQLGTDFYQSIFGGEIFGDKSGTWGIMGRSV